MALTILDDDAHIQALEHFAPDDGASRTREPKRHLHLVPSRDMTSCRTVYANQQLEDEDARANALRVIQSMQSQRDWPLWSALREMYSREASKEEDLIYGILGLLGVTLSPNSIRYGIRFRGALQLLVDALHVDQRLLLTVVESYHGTFIDGFCALPAFKDPTAVPAARLNHITTLGTAEFHGHSGMLITAPTMTCNLDPKMDESDRIKAKAGIMQQELVDVLEEQGAMDRWDFLQQRVTDMRTSQGLAKIAPGNLTLGVTLIAVTQVDAPSSDLFRRWGDPRMTFCCLVCVPGGSVKHKVGLALVVAAKHVWNTERHLVA